MSENILQNYAVVKYTSTYALVDASENLIGTHNVRVYWLGESNHAALVSLQMFVDSDGEIHETFRASPCRVYDLQKVSPNALSYLRESMKHVEVGTTMTREEFIAMKMLVRFKELRKEQPRKPQPDIGWMLDLLEVVRKHS